MLSEGGKKLSSDDLTKEEAEKRLRQVEFFKNRDAKTWAKKRGR